MSENLKMLADLIHARCARLGDARHVNLAADFHLLFCHLRTDGKFNLWGGFEVARRYIQHADAKRVRPTPTLILGMHSRALIMAQQDPAEVLQYPGVQYLRYDASDGQLRDALTATMDGVKTPIPECLKAKDAKELAKLLLNITHCIENLDNNLGMWLYGAKRSLNAGTPAEYLSDGVPPFFRPDQQDSVDGLKLYRSLLVSLIGNAAPLIRISDDWSNLRLAWGELEKVAPKLSTSASDGNELIGLLEEIERRALIVRNSAEDLTSLLKIEASD